MTPDEIVDRFSGLSALVQRYCTHLQRQDKDVRFQVDAERRIEQAAWLLRDFRRSELHFQEGGRVTHDWPPRGLAEELRLYGEAFYYFAWRGREALDAAGIRFDPIGVRNVRNRMIEPPDAKNGVLASFWTLNCPEGLILAALHARGLDKGLYPDAEEYISKLVPKLEAQLTSATSDRLMAPPLDSK
jgi:hypothetical protein